LARILTDVGPGDANLELALDLDCWIVTLTSGEVVSLRAHAVADEAGFLVFVALMKGSPPFEYELARFPSSAVETWEGGWKTLPA
jgi:hypothetical protein